MLWLAPWLFQVTQSGPCFLHSHNNNKKLDASNVGPPICRIREGRHIPEAVIEIRGENCLILGRKWPRNNKI